MASAKLNLLPDGFQIEDNSQEDKLPNGFQVEDQAPVSSSSPAQAARGAMAVRGLPVLGSLLPGNAQDLANQYVDESQLPNDFKLEDQVGNKTSDYKGPEQKRELSKYYDPLTSEEGKSNPNAQVLDQSFKQGLYGHKLSDADRILQEKHPVISALGQGAGQLIGLAGVGSGVEPIVAQATKAAIAKGGISLIPAITSAANVGKGAATFGLKTTLDKLGKIFRGESITGEDLGDVTKSAATGATFGAADSVASPLQRLTAQGLVGYGSSKLDGADDFNSAINGAVNVLFGLTNHTNYGIDFKQKAVDHLTDSLGSKLTEVNNVTASQGRAQAKSFIYNSAVKATGINDPDLAMKKVLEDPSNSLDYFEALDNHIKAFTGVKKLASENQPIQPEVAAAQEAATAGNQTSSEATKSPIITEAEKHGTVVGIDAGTKLPIIDTSKPANLPALAASTKPQENAATPLDIPEFKNTDEALSFAKNTPHTADVVKSLDDHINDLRQKASVLLDQGDEQGYINITSGQKQFANEALKEIQKKPLEVSNQGINKENQITAPVNEIINSPNMNNIITKIPQSLIHQPAIEKMVNAYKNNDPDIINRPISVKKVNGGFDIIEGHHRYLAAKEAGINAPMVLLKEKEVEGLNSKAIDALAKKKYDLERNIKSDVSNAASKGELTPSLYHETSPYTASWLATSHSDASGLNVATDKDLALGQKGKGVIIEFDKYKLIRNLGTSGSYLKPIKKPGTDVVGQKEFSILGGEINPGKVKSITVKPGVKFLKSEIKRLKNYFPNVENLPDGTRIFKPEDSNVQKENVPISKDEKISKSPEGKSTIKTVGTNESGLNNEPSNAGKVLNKEDYYNKIKSKLGNESGQANLPGVNEIAAITKDLINYTAPRAFVPRESLDTVMTELGKRNKLEFELETSMGKITKFFDKQDPKDNIAFIDRIKLGQKQPTKELQSVADMMRDVEDIMHAEAKQFKPSLAYKDNHYRVLWKVIPGSKAANATAKGGFKGVFRRPFQGSKGFAKQSTLTDMSEGIQKGGIPQSYNPSVMWQNGLVDMQKFITANRMFDTLKNTGYVKFVKLGDHPPDGFKQLDDRISKVYFPTPPGLVHAGNYYVEENTSRILNNFLSRDLIRESNAGKGLLGLKNLTTSLELSLSPFHAAYTALTSSASEIGTGLQKMYNIGLLQGNGKEFLKGLSDIALSVRAPYYLTRIGTNVIQMVREKGFLQTPAGKAFLKEFPNARDLLDDLFTGGGKLAMHQDYKINSLRAFKEGLKNKDPWAVTLSSLPAANETIMKPLFEQFIPRLKIGNFLREYSQELVARSNQLASGKLTRPQLARQVWDSVENRFGEMNFDNLFWNRTFKSAMQLLFRSVTWKIGALKNISSGTAGQIGEIVDAIKGRHAPKLNRNTAYLLGIAALIVAASEIIQKSNGQGDPKSLKDLMAPRYDNEGNRISLNTHLKDWIHIAHSPAGFVQNSLSGDIGKEFDIWNNKDFYGVKIYNQDDPIWKKEFDKMKHRFPTPFSITSLDRLNQMDAPTSLEIATALGLLQPSPKYITSTKAEQLASEIVKDKMPIGGRTQEEFDKSKLRFKLMEDYRKNGDLTQINQALEDGKINKKQMNDIIKKSSQTPLERLTNHMSYDEVSRVIEEADKKELETLIPIFTNKIDRKIKLTHDEFERKDLDKIKSDLLNKYQ